MEDELSNDSNNSNKSVNMIENEEDSNNDGRIYLF